MLPGSQGTSQPCATEVQNWLDSVNAGSAGPLSIEISVPTQGGQEAFRWYIHGYVPTAVAAGFQGPRFTFTHVSPPDTVVDVLRSNPWGYESLFQPPADRRVLIQGANAGAFPAVISETPTGMTLEYGFLEGGYIEEWVRNTVSFGSLQTRSDVSVFVVDAAQNDVSRMLYFGCFPRKYEHFTGFVQALQAKERVILQCNSRQAS
jgi:hypothetical protein